jgi:hypothetical protein
MKYHLLDVQNIYFNTIEIEEGAMLPKGTEVAPPVLTGTEVALWLNNAWVVLPVYPQQPKPSNRTQSVYRQEAYSKEADPINFMMQRGDATEQEWLDKIAEIKARFPYYYDADGNLLEAQ